MNNHQGHRKRDEEFLGTTHPHVGSQHGHEELVHDRNCDEWMKEWVRWILKRGYKSSPLVGQETNPFEQDYGSYFSVDENKEVGVKFLSSSPYGKGYGYGFEPIKRGNWDIFAAPIVFFNADLEYPSLDEDKLKDLTRKQIESVSKCEVVLDGHSLECCRVSIVKPFEVNGIPEDNVMGIGAEELRDNDYKVNVVCEGYVLFLNPLPPGLHTLRFEAYSPTYGSSVDMLMNVRGP